MYIRITESRKAQRNSLKVRLELAGPARHPGGVAGGHPQLVHLGAQGGDAVGLGEPRRHGGPQADLTLAVEPVDARGGLGGDQLDHVVQAGQPAVAAGHEQAGDGGGVVAPAVLDPHLDVVVLVHRLVPEAGDPLVAAHHDAQGVGDVGGVDAQVGGAIAVDLDPQLGLVELQGGVGVEQAQLGRLLAQPLGVVVEHVEIGPQQGEVDVVVGAAADEGLRVAHRHAHVGHTAQTLPDLLLDVALAVVALEGAPGRPGCSRRLQPKVRSSWGASRT